MKKCSKSKQNCRGAENAKDAEITEEILHKVLVLLITTQNHGKIKSACQEKLGLTSRQTTKAIAEASGKIAAAAVWNRDIEAGKALLRHEDIYERALAVQDTKAALAAEIARQKLLGLHKPQAAEPAESRDSELETIIRAHLEPLELAPPGTAMEELLRLASVTIIALKPWEMRNATDGQGAAPRPDAAKKPRKVGGGKGTRKPAPDPKSAAADESDV